MKRFLIAAAALLAFFALCHLSGLRQDLGVISLSPPEGESLEGAAFGAALYLASYFGATLLAPVLLIAGAIYSGLLVLARRFRAARSPAVLPSAPRPLQPS